MTMNMGVVRKNKSTTTKTREALAGNISECNGGSYLTFYVNEYYEPFYTKPKTLSMRRNLLLYEFIYSKSMTFT